MPTKKDAYIFSLLIFCATIHLPTISHSPVFGINTRYMMKGKWGYQFKNLYLTNDEGRDTVDLRSTLMYGVTDRLTIDFALPYFLRYSTTNRVAGLSDATFKLNYIFYERETDESKLRLFVQDLVRFPTGNACKSPALGTGTYRNRFGLTGDYDTQWYGVYVASIYECSLSTFKGLRPGDLWEFTLTMEGKPSINWAYVASIDYYTLLKDSQNGVPDTASGGKILYVGPEVYYHSEHIKVAGSAQFPAFRRKLKSSIRAGFYITIFF